MKYWIAFTRGADFERLKHLGFRTLYPTLDDYVFLESKKENRSLISRQEDIGVSFLRDSKGLIEINEDEVSRMEAAAGEQRKVKEGGKIRVVSGVGDGLEGVVVSVEGGKMVCRLKGYGRDYEVEVTPHEVVPLD